MTWKRIVKSLFSAAGLHLVRMSEDPQSNLVGLRSIPFGTIIDVGANEGQFAREFIRHFPAANFYCFEPLPATYAKLKSWAATVPRVKAINCALGETEHFVSMFSHTRHSPSSSILRATDHSRQLFPFTAEQEEVSVPVRRLDDQVTTGAVSLSGKVLLKLDVQGYEKYVLRGAKSMLSKTAACIVEVSVDGLYEDQTQFRDVFAELDSCGFRYAGNLGQVHAADGHVIYLDAVFLR